MEFRNMSTTTTTTPWENPMGTAGFEFIEYTAPDPIALGKVFETLGFNARAVSIF
jgi:4-hydroxyphenylpyruvate dioxygenase